MDLFQFIQQNRNSISELQKNHPPPLDQILSYVRNIVRQIIGENNEIISKSIVQKHQQTKNIQKQVQQKLAEVESLFSADIKRIRRQITQIKSQGSQDPILRSALGQQGQEDPDLSTNAKKRLQKQISHLWTFMQQYIDENSLDRIKKIQKSKIQRLRTSRDLTRVMNQLQWTARYSQFISPDCVQNLILCVKQMYNRSSDKQLCIRYTNGTHQSIGVITTLRLLGNAQISLIMKNDLNKENLVIVLLQVMQPLLVNNQNLQKCKNSKTSITSLLIRLIKRHQLHKVAQKKSTQSNEQAPKDLKYTMRCMASCLRDQDILQQLIKSSGDIVIQLFLSILIVIEDQQILANTSKCIRMFLINENCFQILNSSQYASAISNVLLDCVQRMFESNAIVNESIQALQSFVSVKQNVRLLDPQKIKSLIRVVQIKQDEKIRQKSKIILKICSDSSQVILEQIKSMGCIDMLRK